MKKLLALLHAAHPLSETLQKHLLDTVLITDIKKRKSLVRPGQRCDRMYFIEKGLMRGSKIQDDEESCRWFMKEDDLMTLVSSYYKREPSTEYIHAMEDSRLYSLTRAQLDHIYDAWPEFNFNGRVLTEQYYMKDDEKNDMLKIKRAPDRYDRFLQLYPGLDQRVPAKYIASYLSITMETLSRIKHKR